MACVLAEVGEDPLAQLAQRQVRGVKHDIGLVADRVEHAPLLGDRAGDAALIRERVAVAGLREAPDQDLVAGLEEEDLGLDPAALEGAAHGGQGQRCIAGAHVEDDRHPLESLTVLRDQLGQPGQQLPRQVVDAGVAEILEELRRGRLARSRQPAQDHDVLVDHGRGIGLGCAGRARCEPSGSRRSIGVRRPRVVYAAGGPRRDDHRPLRLIASRVSSVRMYIVTPGPSG